MLTVRPKMLMVLYSSKFIFICLQVFKDGKKSTKEKAIKKGVYLVSVLWLDSCKCNGKRVPEEDFPVLCGNNAENSPIIPGRLKRYKSMQPKSFEEEVKLSAGIYLLSGNVQYHAHTDHTRPFRKCTILTTPASLQECLLT